MLKPGEALLDVSSSFPVGTVVGAYLEEEWLGDSGWSHPGGPAVQTATVSEDGQLTYTGLKSDGTRYVAAAKILAEPDPWASLRFGPQEQTHESATAEEIAELRELVEQAGLGTVTADATDGPTYRLPNPHMAPYPRKLDLTVEGAVELLPWEDIEAGDELMVTLRQDGGPFAITWAAGFIWGYGPEPSHTPNEDAIDVVGVASSSDGELLGFPGGYDFQ